jgi:uncharacterized hydrophobic protein (TIGR00271 family)
MYKLTAICPTEDSRAAVAALREQRGVSKVVRTRSIAGDTEVDVITAYVHRRSSDAALQSLRRLRRWESGDITLIDVAMVGTGELDIDDVSEKEDDDGDGLAWDIIVARAVDESRLTWWYLALMALAGLIAGVGLLANIPILLVGAMSLSPDLAPVNAIAVTLTVGALHRLWRALRTLGAGLAVAIGFIFLLATVLQVVGLQENLLARVSAEMIIFVTVVNHVTVIVALASGVAAMVAFATDRGQSVVGVAISVTTVPAAAYAGLALAEGEFELAGSALVVLGVNILCVTLAQILTLLVLKAARERRLRRVARGVVRDG